MDLTLNAATVKGIPGNAGINREWLKNAAQEYCWPAGVSRLSVSVGEASSQTPCVRWSSPDVRQSQRSLPTSRRPHNNTRPHRTTSDMLILENTIMLRQLASCLINAQHLPAHYLATNNPLIGCTSHDLTDDWLLASTHLLTVYAHFVTRLDVFFYRTRFIWQQCTIRQYHSDLSDQSALEIRVRI